MAFSRSIQVNGVTYRRHEAVGISHELGARTVVHVRSTERADGGGLALDTWHEHGLDDAMGFEAAEAWLMGIEAFAEHEDPYREAVEQFAPTLDDGQASAVPWAYPEWGAEGSYAAGERVRHGGTLYKCLQAHDAQASWSPDAAPSLWTRVLAEPQGDGGEPGYPEWAQPDSTNPYMAGDRVTHGGRAWESQWDNNVHEPGVAGWAEIAA